MVAIMAITGVDAVAPAIAGTRRSRRARNWALWSAGIFLVVLVALPLAWHQSPTAINLIGRLQAPSLSHPFGTDEYGRDVLARFLVGGRLSLAIGLIATGIAVAVGLLVGSVAGYLGGLTDGTLMRLMDALLSFPALFLGLAVAIAIGPGILACGVAVVAASVPWYARRVRSEVLSLRARPFIEAEQVLGRSRWHILTRHVIPAVTRGVVIQGSIGVGYAVLTVAGLGFIGLGVQPPTAEWGTMITDGRQYLLTGQWWISVFPGIGLLIFVALTMAVARALSARSES
jgi:peptide/nickel transport system permease protein